MNNNNMNEIFFNLGKLQAYINLIEKQIKDNYIANGIDDYYNRYYELSKMNDDELEIEFHKALPESAESNLNKHDKDTAIAMIMDAEAMK